MKVSKYESSKFFVSEFISVVRWSFWLSEEV